MGLRRGAAPRRATRGVEPGDYYGDPHALSYGTLRYICLATLLLQPEPPSLILIDEPELGLHPAAIVHLADLVRAVPDDHRILLSTQSVTLLNQFDVDDIVVVDRKDGASTSTRPDHVALASWLWPGVTDPEFRKALHGSS